jgi:hypothetical protein
MEKRLLTLLDDTLTSDTDRRQSLTRTLANIRREKANLILKLNANTPGATLTPSASEANALAAQGTPSPSSTP